MFFFTEDSDGNKQITIVLNQEQVESILDRLERRAMKRLEERISKKIEEKKEKQTRFTYDEVASILKVSRQALKKRVQKGHIKATLRDTNSPIILREDLMYYLTEKKGMLQWEAEKLIDG